jgi:hypothetical protein
MSQIVASGTTGACAWKLTRTSRNYTLTISGTGAMDNYSSSSNSPWHSYRNDITTLDLQQGVTTIGNYAFSFCSRLTSVINLSLVPQIINSNIFDDVNKSNCSLIVPTSSVSAYKNAAVWRDFAPNITGR